ncbi:hypothetical protein SAMN05444143_11275 [Flavobacterium succinicans]|uniref:Outermembrane protein n=1 Tax=Flavobacterium succinicans TaxID=29536 RepID=A0A1I4YR24_9FLAO|nr:hypothetical protein [Flavobacterium succinicans]SFN40223.1 hypothetical protein SAMN05444143_11275 [Flavobacterium succinicans]
MKTSYYYFVLFLTTTIAFAQENTTERYTAHNKGKFFISWGGNRESYSKSDVTFTGKDYRFTVADMRAHDKPKGWHIDYINPTKMTIPQTNLRLGYFFSDHYSVAIGVDHMKYVMTQNQTANVTGQINGPIHNDIYNNTPVDFSDESFLTFEHTDGLNYINTEVSRHDDISKLFKIGNTDKIQINLTEGIGFGVLYPKTNTQLLGKERYDEFHLAGFGTSIKAGLNITFFKYFYVQGELKGGYINMNDIRTTINPEDRASQDFFFFQRILAVGGKFRI